MTERLSDDMLRGAEAIAQFLLGDNSTQNRRRIYHLASSKSADRLPIFRLGSELCARKSTLRETIEKREAVALGASSDA